MRKDTKQGERSGTADKWLAITESVDHPSGNVGKPGQLQTSFINQTAENSSVKEAIFYFIIIVVSHHGIIDVLDVLQRHRRRISLLKEDKKVG